MLYDDLFEMATQETEIVINYDNYNKVIEWFFKGSFTNAWNNRYGDCNR